MPLKGGVILLGEFAVVLVFPRSEAVDFEDSDEELEISGDPGQILEILRVPERKPELLDDPGGGTESATTTMGMEAEECLE
ncbi:hypothetical protein L2E82_46988 [Cichorium intybus]|uniref:Uncharacterized protein n=1 Tax=Cichorium intybus TaxID=13427 RepID=A0ACB8YVC8_CICIN|nr:hypothetical protein L2E82_46988 [Cichorium intybus]